MSKHEKNTSPLENDNEGLFLFPALDAQLLNCWTAKLLRLRSCSFPTCPDPATLPLGYVLHSNLGFLRFFFTTVAWILRVEIYTGYIMDLWYQYVCCGAKLLRRWKGEHIYEYGSKVFDLVMNDAWLATIRNPHKLDPNVLVCLWVLTQYVYPYVVSHASDVDIQMVYINMSMLILSCVLLVVGKFQWETMKTKSLWICDYPDWLLESMIGMSCWNSNVELEMGICMN